ncbi:MAG: histidine--tRNA ligase [Candidatus Omnitrophica bacterium]|nr:histidine--tRNA ligase [Candidatus Omnitrophota bacterium]
MAKYIKVRGMHDILPDDISKWQFIEKVITETVKLYGYKEIRTPLVESRSLFERSIGSESDIVSKEIYAFKDRKGRDIALRPEGTASVVRAFIESGMCAEKKVFRLYYYGPMFRYDRPQKGRYRQFYQFGIELFGSEHPFFDGEVVAMLYMITNKLKLQKFYFLINTLGCFQCKNRYSDIVKDYFSKMEQHLCNDCKRRIITSPLRILDCKNPGCKKTVSGAPVIGNVLCNDCKEHFNDFEEYLKLNNIPYKVDPYLVRGLDYYTRTVFELYVEGEENAIAAGGRYDTLVHELGGPYTPAVGFAIGIERLISLVEYSPSQTPFFYFACIGKEAKSQGAIMINELRKEGITVETDYGEESLSSHLKTANRAGANWCIIIGENEIKREEFIVKDMSSGSQITIPFNNYINRIKELLK